MKIYTISRGERGEGHESITDKCFRTRSALLKFCHRHDVFNAGLDTLKLKVSDFNEDGVYWIGGEGSCDYFVIEEFHLEDGS